MLILNPQWQGWGEADTIAAGSKLLAQALGQRPDVEVPVPPFHALTTRDGVLGLDEQLDQIRWLGRRIDEVQPSKLVHLAGDCGAQLAPIAWLNKRHAGRLNLVWVDAHADLNTPQTSPSGTFHGMILRTLLGEGQSDLVDLVASPIQFNRVSLVGVRALDQEENRFIEQEGLNCCRPDQLDLSGPTYIHIDLDSIEPAEFGHVPFPEPGGLTISDVTEILQKLRLSDTCEVVGVGLTESAATEPDHVEKLRPLLTAVQLTM